MLFDSLCFPQRLYDLSPVMVEDFIVDLDIFLVAAQEIQLIYFEINSFLLSECFDNRYD